MVNTDLARNEIPCHFSCFKNELKVKALTRICDIDEAICLLFNDALTNSRHIGGVDRTR